MSSHVVSDTSVRSQVESGKYAGLVASVLAQVEAGLGSQQFTDDSTDNNVNDHFQQAKKRARLLGSNADSRDPASLALETRFSMGVDDSIYLQNAVALLVAGHVVSEGEIPLSNSDTFGPSVIDGVKRAIAYEAMRDKRREERNAPTRLVEIARSLLWLMDMQDVRTAVVRHMGTSMESKKLSELLDCDQEDYFQTNKAVAERLVLDYTRTLDGVKVLHNMIIFFVTLVDNDFEPSYIATEMPRRAVATSEEYMSTLQAYNDQYRSPEVNAYLDDYLNKKWTKEKFYKTPFADGMGYLAWVTASAAAAAAAATVVPGGSPAAAAAAAAVVAAKGAIKAANAGTMPDGTPFSVPEAAAAPPSAAAAATLPNACAVPASSSASSAPAAASSAAAASTGASMSGEALPTSVEPLTDAQRNKNEDEGGFITGDDTVRIVRDYMVYRVLEGRVNLDDDPNERHCQLRGLVGQRGPAEKKHEKDVLEYAIPISRPPKILTEDETFVASSGSRPTRFTDKELDIANKLYETSSPNVLNEFGGDYAIVATQEDFVPSSASVTPTAIEESFFVRWKPRGALASQLAGVAIKEHALTRCRLMAKSRENSGSPDPVSRLLWASAAALSLRKMQDLRHIHVDLWTKQKATHIVTNVNWYEDVTRPLARFYSEKYLSYPLDAGVYQSFKQSEVYVKGDVEERFKTYREFKEKPMLDRPPYYPSSPYVFVGNDLRLTDPAEVLFGRPQRFDVPYPHFLVQRPDDLLPSSVPPAFPGPFPDPSNASELFSDAGNGTLPGGFNGVPTPSFIAPTPDSSLPGTTPAAMPPPAPPIAPAFAAPTPVVLNASQSQSILSSAILPGQSQLKENATGVNYVPVSDSRGQTVKDPWYVRSPTFGRNVGNFPYARLSFDLQETLRELFISQFVPPKKAEDVASRVFIGPEVLQTRVVDTRTYDTVPVNQIYRSRDLKAEHLSEDRLKSMFWAGMDDCRTIEARLRSKTDSSVSTSSDAVAQSLLANDSLGTPEAMRGSLWKELLRELAISNDRLWVWVRTLSGSMGEEASTLLSAADETAQRAQRVRDQERKAIAERVATFNAKIVEILVSNMLRTSKLQMVPQEEGDFVVVDEETAKDLRALASGESGRPFFEANVAIQGILEAQKGQKTKLSDIVASFNDVVGTVHQSLNSELTSGAGGGMTLAEVAQARNSYFVSLRDDVRSAIRSALDRFRMEMGGPRPSLWELVEGASPTLSLRWAELVGHTLLMARTSTGSSALYVSSNMLQRMVQQARVSLLRLVEEAQTYVSSVAPPDYSSQTGRNEYFTKAGNPSSAHKRVPYYANIVIGRPVVNSDVSGWQPGTQPWKF